MSRAFIQLTIIFVKFKLDNSIPASVCLFKLSRRTQNVDGRSPHILALLEKFSFSLQTVINYLYLFLLCLFSPSPCLLVYSYMLVRCLGMDISIIMRRKQAHTRTYREARAFAWSNSPCSALKPLSQLSLHSQRLKRRGRQALLKQFSHVLSSPSHIALISVQRSSYTSSKHPFDTNPAQHNSCTRGPSFTYHDQQQPYTWSSGPESEARDADQQEELVDGGNGRRRGGAR